MPEVTLLTYDVARTCIQVCPAPSTHTPLCFCPERTSHSLNALWFGDKPQSSVAKSRGWSDSSNNWQPLALLWVTRWAGPFCTSTQLILTTLKGFPGGASGKEHACQCSRCKRRRFSPGLGRSPGEGNGYPLQYSYLEKPMDRGAWRATVHVVAQNGT